MELNFGKQGASIFFKILTRKGEEERRRKEKRKRKEKGEEEKKGKRRRGKERKGKEKGEEESKEGKIIFWLTKDYSGFSHCILGLTIMKSHTKRTQMSL